MSDTEKKTRAGASGATEATGGDLKNRMRIAAFHKDALKDPEDALLFYGAPKEVFERWERGHFAQLVMEAAKATGADPRQIANKATRTPEQQKALTEAAAKQQIARLDAFFASNWMKAIETLREIPFDYDDDDAKEGYMTVKEVYALYFFATHSDIKPGAPANMTDDDINALKATFFRFAGFINARFEGDRKAFEAAAGVNDGAGLLELLETFAEMENPAEAQEVLTRISSVIPTKYVIPNNKAINAATSATAADLTQGLLLEVIKTNKRGKGAPIETAISLSYEGDNVNITGRQPFTNYDREVYNALSTLFVYGDPAHIVTPAMVWRTMVGATDTEKPTPQQIGAVTRSIDKMRFMRTRIDCSAELAKYGATLDGLPVARGVVDTYLLKADVLTVEAGGRAVSAFKISDTPILYSYANKTRQVFTVAAALLDVREVDRGRATPVRIANTESRILIKGHLLRRISGMKGKNALANRVISLVSYERDGKHHAGLYEIAGYTDPTKQDAEKVRKYAAQVLDYWKAEGFIKGYDFTKTGRAKTGIEIQL